MTVSITTTRVQYDGDGVTTTFTYPFMIYEDTDLVVIHMDADNVETVFTLNTDYTVTGEGTSTGGTVVLVDATDCATGETLTILRDMDFKQETDFVDGDAFSSESFEDALDKHTLELQQLSEEVLRAAKLPRSSEITDLELPFPEASKFIGWNPTATNFENKAEPVATSTGATYIAYVSNYASFAAAVTAIGSTATKLILDTGTTVSTTVSTPVTLEIEGTRMGGVTVANGVTLTINGDFNAGLYQVFNCVGTGTVAGLKYSKPEWFGGLPTTDGSTDCAAALDLMVAASGRNIFTHWGSGYYYKVATATAITANHFIEGEGSDRPQIYNDTADAYAVFTITGADGSEIDNITFKHLNIRNGTSTTGAATSGKDCIKGEYVTNLTIEDCKFPDAQGYYSIYLKWAEDVKILHNIFTQWTYTAIGIMVESKNILIQYNKLGTALSTTESQQYAINSGGDTLLEGTYSVINLKVLDNTFEYDTSLSSSDWYAIVSHGGSYIWIERNKILNYIAGIQVVLSSGYWSNPLTKNVWVRDNVVDRGTSTTLPAGHTDHQVNGIQVQGLEFCSDGDFTIEGNYVKGMGYASPVSAAIIAGYGYNIKINKNRIENYINYGIYLQKGINGGEVLYNDIKNDTGTGTSYAIYANTGGLYGVLVDYNNVWGTTLGSIPTYGVFSSTTYYHNVIVGIHNDIQTATQSVVGLNWGYSDTPTTKYWKQGDPVFRTYGTGALWGVAKGINEDGYYGWLKTAQTCTGTSGEYSVTLGNTALYYEFPKGARVAITQDDASTLTTTVLNITSAGVLTLADPMTANVTAGAIAMVTPLFECPAWKRILTDISSSGTGEDSLVSWGLPANTLTIYNKVVIRVAGTITGANGNKTIKVKWGSTILTTYPAANATADWSAEVVVYQTSTAALQRIVHRGFSGTTLVAQGYDTATEDTTAEVTIAVTGECANINDVITKTIFEVTNY